MKITNSSIQNNSLASYRSLNNGEKAQEALDEIEDKNNLAKDTADTIALSDKAKKLLEDAELVKDITRQMEAAASSESSPYDEMTKCMLIANRIIKGEKVPQTDIMFLAEKQPELYSSAILMKQNNQNPKRHKSLLEDEKDNSVELDSGKAEIQEALANRSQPTEE